MHKLTPQATRTIDALCLTLPKLIRKNPDGTIMERKLVKRVLGKDLPKSYKKENDWYPMRYYSYTYTEPILINHKVYLIECFKKDGYEGLDYYTNHVVNVLSELPKEKEEKKLNWFQRLFKTKKTVVK